MKHHGVMVIGDSIPEAWDDLLPKGGVWPIGDLADLASGDN